MATVWVHAASALIERALATLVARSGYNVRTAPAPPPEADLAICYLRDLQPPYPPPPDIPTLAIVSGIESDKMSALHLGYRGYLIGEESPEDLRRALKMVLEGEFWIERHLVRHLVDAWREEAAAEASAPLTPREHEVLSLISRGFANKHIAQQLGISVKTVKVYVSRILKKSGVKSRVDLVIQSRRNASPVERVHVGRDPEPEQP